MKLLNGVASTDGFTARSKTRAKECIPEDLKVLRYLTSLDSTFRAQPVALFSRDWLAQWSGARIGIARWMFSFGWLRSLART